MAKVTKLEELEQENGIPQMIIGNAHKLFQVGLGAVMMVQDEVVNFTDKLIEQGETTESKSRKRVDDFVDDRKKETKNLSKRLEKDWDKRMTSLLQRVSSTNTTFRFGPV